ncbi:MAG: signal peptidase I [Methanotrichaceae archaeon]|nr:signal peptidase I [Methanotrichaceae archaeon]
MSIINFYQTSFDQNPIIAQELIKTNIYFLHIGQSMNPTILEKDIIEVKPYDCYEIKAGDILIFRSPRDGKFIAHRAISVKDWGIFTRGDNNVGADPWCLNHELIVGKVIASWRHGNQRKIRGGRIGLLSIGSAKLIDKIKQRIIYKIYIIHTVQLRNNIFCNIFLLFILINNKIFKIEEKG